jgi:hypothetical protein
MTNLPFEVCLFLAQRSGPGNDGDGWQTAWHRYLFEGSAGAVLHTCRGPVRVGEARAVQAAIEDAYRTVASPDPPGGSGGAG